MAGGIIITWAAPESDVTYDRTRIYRASSINGTYTVLATQSNITDTAYFDVTGTTASWYKIAFIVYNVTPSLVVESDLSPPMKGLPALTIPSLVIEKAQMSGTEQAVNNELFHIILETMTEMREMYGNPFYQYQIPYNSDDSAPRYTVGYNIFGIGERDALVVDRVYSLNYATYAPTRTELVAGTDYYYDPVYGELTFLTTQHDSAGNDLELWVEYTPQIFRTLATLLAARRYLRRVYQRSGDRYAQAQMATLDAEIFELKYAMATRSARVIRPLNKISPPATPRYFADFY